MSQHFVLALVIVVSVWAHIWMFLWIRFKVDEAVIIRYLDDCSTTEPLSIQIISKEVGLAANRVSKAALRSSDLKHTEGLVQRVV